MESRLQARIIRFVEKSGGFALKIIRCNKAGFPDLILYFPDDVIYIEVKDKGKKLDPLQSHRHDELRKYGVFVHTVDNFDEFLEILNFK